MRNEGQIFVSMIIPVYNSEEYLPELWEGISKQRYSFFEIIFIDDGSSDGSSRLLQEYAKNDSRVVLIQKKNEGRNAARLDGVRCARGKYVAFVDSDDVIDECYLSNLVAPLMVNEEKWDVIIGGTRIYESGMSIKHLPEGEVSYNTLWKNMISLEGIGWTLWGKLYRKSCVNDLNDKYVLAEDLYSNWNICNNTLRYYYVPKDGYIYRIHNIKNYISDTGAIDVLIKIGNNMSNVLKNDKSFMLEYCIRTFYEIMTFVRGVLFYEKEGYEDIIIDSFTKWSEWVRRFLLGKYNFLEPFYRYYLSTYSILISEYIQFENRLKTEKSKKKYIYGAGIQAKKIASWMEQKGIQFEGFVVSKDAEKQKKIDHSHHISNVSEITSGIIIWGMKMTNIIEVIENVDIERFDVVYL